MVKLKNFGHVQSNEYDLCLCYFEEDFYFYVPFCPALKKRKAFEYIV